MRIKDLMEGRNHPVIVVDVQPAYDKWITFPMDEFCDFLNNQYRVLYFFNGDTEGFTEDTEDDVKNYLYEYGIDESTLDRIDFREKIYGFFRSWMDYTTPSVIIKTLREMVRQGVNDSRMLFGEDEGKLKEFLGSDFNEYMIGDPLILPDVDLRTLKEYNGAYLVGGGRHECMAEIMILMSAFNIKYKIYSRFIYGD